MTKHWLLIALAVCSALFSASAVACSDDNNDGGEAAATQPASDTPDRGVAATGDAVEVNIAEVAGSGVTGTATLTPTRYGFFVVVEVDGGLEPGPHFSSIGRGLTCATIRSSPPDSTSVNGATVHPRQPAIVRVDASGAGTATTSISEAELSTFQGGNSYVAVFATGQASAIVGCGDIPPS